MKRLLMVTTSYPDHSEGAAAAGSFVADFAAELVRQDVAVTLIAPANVATFADEQGVQVHRFAVPHLPLSTLNPARPTHWSSIARTLLAGQKAVNEACANQAFDHILALWALPSGEWARRASQRFGIPYSTWALGSDIWSLGRIPLVRQLLAHVLRTARIRFADGYQLGRDVTQISGKACVFLPSTRILPARPRQRPVASEPPYRLGFLGRWHQNKGIDLLLDALALLEAQDWARIESIRIAGGGPLQADVTRLVGALQQAGRPIELSGYLDREAATDFLQSIDYLIIPSRIESIPVVFSDAMQVGTPVIASPVGDLPQLLDEHDCGLTLEAVNAKAFASGIRQALAIGAASFLEGTARASGQFEVSHAVRTLKRHLSFD